MPGGSKAAARLCRTLAALIPPHAVYLETHNGASVIMKRKPPAQRNIDIDLDTCRLQLRLSARTGARMLSPHLREFEPAAGVFTVLFDHWVNVLCPVARRLRSVIERSRCLMPQRLLANSPHSCFNVHLRQDENVSQRFSQVSGSLKLQKSCQISTSCKN